METMGDLKVKQKFLDDAAIRMLPALVAGRGPDETVRDMAGRAYGYAYALWAVRKNL